MTFIFFGIGNIPPIFEMENRNIIFKLTADMLVENKTNFSLPSFHISETLLTLFSKNIGFENKTRYSILGYTLSVYATHFLSPLLSKVKSLDTLDFQIAVEILNIV